jgi:hypothetical protein
MSHSAYAGHLIYQAAAAEVGRGLFWSLSSPHDGRFWLEAAARAILAKMNATEPQQTYDKELN